MVICRGMFKKKNIKEKVMFLNWTELNWFKKICRLTVKTKTSCCCWKVLMVLLVTLMLTKSHSYWVRIIVPVASTEL